MPNHVTTILRAAPAVIDALRSTEEPNRIDFNNIIPFPKVLKNLTAEFKVFPTQAEVDAYQAEQVALFAKWPEGLGPGPDAVHALTQEQYATLRAAYGAHLDWYSWNIQNWGTKWNAYDVEFEASKIKAIPGVTQSDDAPDTLVLYPEHQIEEPDAGLVKFDTAWSFPEPVIITLSQRFPDERIEIAFADEDLGYNYGLFALQNGEVVEGSFEPFGKGTDEATDFAARVKYGKSYAELRAEWDED